jgi:heparan-alpha-glucosaminide N-acetyltransferase
MAFLFNGGDPKAPEAMQPSWWGILGIIGWAYLVCASVYFLVKGKLPAMIILLIVLAAINIVVHSSSTKISIWFIHDASSETLVAAGVVISLWYARMVKKGYNTRMWVWLFVTGCASILVGLLIRPYTQGISKIRSTPSWIFICVGISILVFELMICLVDFKGKKNWFKFIWPAGTSTLTCYLIPYLQVGFYGLFRFHYPKLLNAGIGGFIRSWAVAFIVVFIGGLLEKRRLRLKI